MVLNERPKGNTAILSGNVRYPAVFIPAKVSVVHLNTLSLHPIPPNTESYAVKQSLLQVAFQVCDFESKQFFTEISRIIQAQFRHK